MLSSVHFFFRLKILFKMVGRIFEHTDIFILNEKNPTAECEKFRILFSIHKIWVKNMFSSVRLNLYRILSDTASWGDKQSRSVCGEIYCITDTVRYVFQSKILTTSWGSIQGNTVVKNCENILGRRRAYSQLISLKVDSAID